MTPNPKASCGPYQPSNDTNVFSESFDQQVALLDASDEPPDHDTICMLAVDAQHHVVAGTSTNGLNYKVPGYSNFL